MICKPRIVPPSQSPTGNWIIKAPAVRLLPGGGSKRIASCVTLERPRQSGYAVEGMVRIKGRRYSAFTTGDEIVVRDFMKKKRKK